MSPAPRRRLARILVAAAGSLGLAGGLLACGVDVPRATELDVRRAATQRPGTTLADLERGRSTYLAKCSGCHRPIAPRTIAPDSWPRHIDEMSERAHLTPDDRASIALYLTTLAAPPSPTPSAPSPPTPPSPLGPAPSSPPSTAGQHSQPPAEQSVQ